MARLDRLAPTSHFTSVASCGYLHGAADATRDYLGQGRQDNIGKMGMTA